MAQPNLPKTRHWRFEIDFESLGWLTIDVLDDDTGKPKRNKDL